VLGYVGVRTRRRRSAAPPSTRPEPTATPEADPAGTAPAPEAPTAPAPVETTEPTTETPEPVAGRLTRLRSRLARSGSPLGSRLLAVLSRDHLSEDDWDEVEETLLLADVGAGPTGELIDALREQVR